MKKTTQLSETILPESVAANFEIAPGVLSLFVCSEFGEIDLRKITPELAEKLATKGYLIKRTI